MSEDLLHHIANAYGVPDHLKEALREWVASVEARLSSRGEDEYNDDVVASISSRLGAIETAVADLHAALSSSPSPTTVQRAVADVEMPAAEDAKD